MQKTLALIMFLGYNTLERKEKTSNGVGKPTLIYCLRGGNMANIEQKIESLIKDKVNELGYEIYDVEYIKEGREYYLRIYIDKNTGIDIEDCEKVSREINDVIDIADLISEQYFLEVSSPGIERRITKEKHLNDNLNNKVEIRLFKPIDGQKKLEGILKRFDINIIEIEDEYKNVCIDRKNISLIKTVYNWEDIEK